MKAAITLGRFNPPTRGHIAIFDLLLNLQLENTQCFVFIVDGEKSSLDKFKNPLSAEERAMIIRTLYPSSIIVDVVNSAFDVFDVIEVQGYDLDTWLCGSDRTPSYYKLTQHAGCDCKFIEVNRNSGATKDVSATLAREAALSGNTELFISLMPDRLDSSLSIEIMKKIRVMNGV